MDTRIPAGTIHEVLMRMRQLHVDVIDKTFPLSNPEHWMLVEPKTTFNHTAHEEMDLLMLDALVIVGLHELVEARVAVEKSFDGFWYA